MNHARSTQMPTGDSESHTDVLIVGAGPAGLVAALWMAEQGISCRIIDRRGTRVLMGRASSYHSRTLELLDSWGMATPIMEKAQTMAGFTTWSPDENGVLRRVSKRSSWGVESSNFFQKTMNQGQTECYFGNRLREKFGLEVERGVEPLEMYVDESLLDNDTAHPISVKLEHQKPDEIEQFENKAHVLQADGSQKSVRGIIDSMLHKEIRNAFDDTQYRPSSKVGTTEVVHAKYVIGADAARSWVRKQLGIGMKGVYTNNWWAVMDIRPITNFPDIRKLAIINSEHGCLTWVPRPEGLARLIICQDDPNFNPDTLNPESILKLAQKIMQPYSLTYKYCDWWSIFKEGQRVAEKFSGFDRVFLVGDAIHNHTPSAGQGMNTSIQDSWNLGWKIGGVLRGQLNKDILKTYEYERRPIAQTLIDLDMALCKIGNSKAKADPAYVKDIMGKMTVFGSGLNHKYGASPLVSASSVDQEAMDYQTTVAKSDLATKLTLGMRVLPNLIEDHFSERKTNLQSILQGNGAWKLLVFAGDIAQEHQLEKLNNLGEKLRPQQLGSSRGLLEKYNLDNPSNAPLEIFTIHSSSPDDVPAEDLHRTFVSFNECTGYTYDRLYTDVQGTGEGIAQGAYTGCGVNTNSGCMILVRPDQLVGYIGELDDYTNFEKFLSGAFVQQTGVSRRSSEAEEEAMMAALEASDIRKEKALAGIDAALPLVRVAAVPAG